MSNDQNYLALTQIERRMENEVSAFSMADSRLQNYLDFMEKSSTLQINGLLKALSMLAARDERLGEYKSADAAYTWMSALCKGKKSKLYRHMFPTITFEEAIVPQFLKEAGWSHEIEVNESKEAWIMITLTTLVCMTVLALGVLVFHLNFIFCLVITFCLYFFFVTYYCYWYRQRSILLLLEKKREDMSPILRHFVYSLPLQSHPLYPSEKDRQSLRKALWSSEEKPENQKTTSSKQKGKQTSKAKAKTKNTSATIASSQTTRSIQATSSQGPRLSIFAEEEAKQREKEQRREENRQKKASQPTTSSKATKNQKNSKGTKDTKSTKSNKHSSNSKSRPSHKKRPSLSFGLTKNKKIGKSSSKKVISHQFVQSEQVASSASHSTQWN